MTWYAHLSGDLRSAGRAVGFVMALGLCLSSLSSLSDPPTAKAATLAGELPSLSFSVREGRQINAFYRQGPVAAHIVLDSDRAPRLVVAFPAGNSGVGLWFDDQAVAAVWASPEKVEPVSRTAEGGGELHGVTADLSIDAPSLTVRQSVLSSVRACETTKTPAKSPKLLSPKPRSTVRP